MSFVRIFLIGFILYLSVTLVLSAEKKSNKKNNKNSEPELTNTDEGSENNVEDSRSDGEPSPDESEGEGDPKPDGSEGGESSTDGSEGGESSTDESEGEGEPSTDGSEDEGDESENKDDSTPDELENEGESVADEEEPDASEEESSGEPEGSGDDEGSGFDMSGSGGDSDIDEEMEGGDLNEPLEQEGNEGLGDEEPLETEEGEGSGDDGSGDEEPGEGESLEQGEGDEEPLDSGDDQQPHLETDEMAEQSEPEDEHLPIKIALAKGFLEIGKQLRAMSPDQKQCAGYSVVELTILDGYYKKIASSLVRFIKYYPSIDSGEVTSHIGEMAIKMRNMTEFQKINKECFSEVSKALLGFFIENITSASVSEDVKYLHELLATASESSAGEPQMAIADNSQSDQPQDAAVQ